MTAGSASADPTFFPEVTLIATQQVPISGNANAQPAGNLEIQLPIGTGAGSETITVDAPAGQNGNCTSTTQTVAFTAVPTATVGVSATSALAAIGIVPNLPAVTMTIAPDGATCGAASGVNNQLTVNWTMPNGAANAIEDIVLSNVQYNVGSTVANTPPMANPEPLQLAFSDTPSGSCFWDTAQNTPGFSQYPGSDYCDFGATSNALLNNNVPFAGPPVNNGPTNSWFAGATNPTNTGGNAGAVGGFSQTAPLPVVAGKPGAQSVNGWTIQVPDNFGTGDNIVLVVDPQSGFNTNCQTANGNLGFAKVPTVTVAANGDAPAFDPNTTITSSFNLAGAIGAPVVPPIPDAGCTAVGVSNELVIGAKNAGPVGQPAAPAATRPDQTLTISDVAYTATGNVPIGPVTVTAYAVPTGGVGSSEAAPTVDQSSFWGLANAVIFHGTASGPAAPGSVQVAGAQPIGNLTYTETQNGDVPTGSQVCFQINQPSAGGIFWNVSSTTPTVTVDGSSGATASSPATTSPAPPANSAILTFTVTKASSNGPATFTVNNTQVNVAPGTPAGPITGFAGLLAGGNCTPPAVPLSRFIVGQAAYGNFPLNNVGDALGNGFVFPPPGILFLGNVVAGTMRLQGSNRNATAAAILNAENPCNNAVSSGGFAANNDPVVMTVNDNFPDAMSGQYAAANLATGIVLTTEDSIPPETIATMHQNGVQTVFAIGGLDVIHQTVRDQVGQTDAFVCGGTGPRLDANGKPIKMNLRVLAGETRYDTNLAVNTFFPAANVGSSNFTTNAFNPLFKTAILATGLNFPDALSAGAQATDEFYPVILTDGGSLSPQAVNQMEDLGIQQLLVMGGPDAVATSVVTAAQGVSTMKSVIQLFGPDRTATAACMGAFTRAQASAPLSTAAGSFGQACTDPGGSTSPVGLVGPDNTAPDGDSWNIAPVGPAIGLARGDFFADALTSGPFLGFFNDSALVLTFDPNTLGGATTVFLNQIGKPPAGQNPISGLVAFGGPLAISDATMSDAQTALSG